VSAEPQDAWHERFAAELRRSGDYGAALVAADARRLRPVSGAWAAPACETCGGHATGGVCAACASADG